MNRELMEKNTLKINLKVGGVKFPLTIARKDELIYRDAEKLVNKYIEKNTTYYSKELASEEIKVLVAFQIAVTLVKHLMNMDLTPMEEKIKELDQEIDNLLKGL